MDVVVCQFPRCDWSGARQAVNLNRIDSIINHSRKYPWQWLHGMTSCVDFVGATKRANKQLHSSRDSHAAPQAKHNDKMTWAGASPTIYGGHLLSVCGRGTFIEFEVIPIWIELRGRRIEFVRKNTLDSFTFHYYPTNWGDTGCQWNVAISYEMVQLIVKSAVVRMGNWCVP